MIYINSGKCRFCEIGLPAGFSDIEGVELFTGDIVVLLNKPSFYEEGESFHPEGLTAIVSQKYQTYNTFSQGLVHELKPEHTPYVMGIKSVSPSEFGKQWHVKRVKSHKDVIAGEHWTEFGFNYTEESATHAQ